MINQKIQIKINEVESDLLRLKSAPKDPEARRKVVKEVVGDAEEYLSRLLVFLRSL